MNKRAPAPALPQSSEAGPQSAAGFRQRLGWGHRGFRARSPREAVLGLCAVLLLPFLFDQAAFVGRMLYHNPDLKQWRTIAADLVADPSRHVYHEYGGFYLYPPFFLTLIWPLSRMPDWAAALVFETAKWLALVVSLRAAYRLSAPPGEDVPPAVALATLLMTFRFIFNDFGQGNVDLFILLGVLGGCWLLWRGRAFWAGASVATVACVKITPALLLAYFAYKRWWRALAGGLAAAVVWLIVWPGLWYGWADNLRLLGEWYDAVVASFLSHGGVNSIHTNQSLTALLNRLLGPHVAIRPDTYVSLAVLPLMARNVIRAVLAVAALIGLGLICRGRLRPARQPVGLASEVGLVLITMLIFSGYSWKAHFVSLVLPYCVLLAWLADRRYPERRKRVIRVLLTCSFVLGTLTCDIITPRGANYAEAYGAILAAALLAGAGLVLVRSELRRIEAGPLATASVAGPGQPGPTAVG